MPHPLPSDAGSSPGVINRECVLPTDGPIALVAPDGYQGFVLGNWTFALLEAHLVAQMSAGHACAWGFGGDRGNVVVRVTTAPSQEPGHRELVSTLDVGPAGAYLVDHDAITAAAGSPRRAVVDPVKDRARHVAVPPGRYRCRVVQWMDPALAMGPWQLSDAHVHFLVELLPEPGGQLRPVAALPWLQTGDVLADPAAEEVALARTAAKGKRPERRKARDLYNQVLRRFPDRADLWAELAALELDRLGEPARALAAVGKARALLGPRAAADLRLVEAKALERSGPARDLAASERVAREAIALGGESGPRLFVLGDTLDSQGRLREGAELFERGLWYAPNDEKLCWAHVESQYRKLRDGAAAERFLAAREPDLTRMHSGFAEIRAVNLVWNLHDFEKALEVYRGAIARDPGAHLTARMATCHLCLGRIDEARRLAAEALPALAADRDLVRWALEAHFIHFLVAPPEEGAAHLARIAKEIGVFGEQCFADWVFDLMADQAAARGHAEAAWLPALAQVLLRSAPASSLREWPAWRRALEEAEGLVEEGAPGRAEYATNFPGLPVPPELSRLLSFSYGTDSSFFSDGFELAVLEKDDLGSWSQDAAFQQALMPFANATGSGSTYALWSPDGSGDGSSMPVVVLGDEGGVHVVAESLRDLLRILAFDAEPMVDHEKVYFYKSDGHTPSAKADAYRRWLDAQFALAPADDADALVAAAQARFKAPFDAWLRQHVK